MFDLSITFNPNFPKCYYSNKVLSSIASNEGYTEREILNGDPYELLQLAYLSETFYQGELPNIKSIETPISLDEIHEVPYGELLCYGNITDNLNIITISELIDLFTINQNFSSPFDPDSIFSSTSINKLKIILRSHTGPNPSICLSTNTIQLRSTLLDLIKSIELSQLHIDPPTRSFITLYRSSSIDIKHSIVSALTDLLHLGMYMRGWSGSGDYPITKAVVPVHLENQVTINVTQAISKYESSIQSLDKIGIQINNLPLVKYKDGQYHVSTSPDDGFTIYNRLQIIKEGDASDNISSCIRLSSNWICSSAHKYITCIGLPSPFDIFHLRHIA
jgi:hypothetical protein